MKFNERTIRGLKIARQRRELTALGYEQVGEGGGRLWELERGYRYDHEIVDAIVGADGRSVWVKIILKKRDKMSFAA